MTAADERRTEPSDPVVESLDGLDLRGPSGVVWGTETNDLNANVVVMHAGDTMAAHRNDEVDVLVMITSGTGVLDIDGIRHSLAANTLAVIPCGSVRTVEATTTLTYVTVHRRRGGPRLR